MAETTDFKKEQALYYKVFGTLAVLTVVTVAISSLKIGIALAIFLALFVATTKASLVASFFMHLSHEKKLIYLVMSLTAFMFLFMMIFIVYTVHDVPDGTKNLNFEYHVEKPDAHGTHGAHAPKPDAQEASGGHH
ncbi:MAG: cytochrome C oxidase subunit IV family protein [Candidatus Omnitrophica bacterium]|nr:cytochrome C oxidase subunit IV family protein [Candidatus Omnitrophota bacterium]MCB9722106.1 cytochrome C oxidase subunit IV family protein [Candidatus Omnitrophota bacterium]